MEYEFEVIGDIKGKERPRVNTNTGIVYTPARTKDYEDLIKQYFLLKYPRYYYRRKDKYRYNSIYENT